MYSNPQYTKPVRSGFAADAARAIDIAFRISYYALLAMFAVMITVFGLAAFFLTEGTLGHRLGMAAIGVAFPAAGMAVILAVGYIRAKVIGAIFDAATAKRPPPSSVPSVHETIPPEQDLSRN